MTPEEKLVTALRVIDAELRVLRSVVTATIGLMDIAQPNLRLQQMLLQGIRFAQDNIPNDDPEMAEHLRNALKDIEERFVEVFDSSPSKSEP